MCIKYFCNQLAHQVSDNSDISRNENFKISPGKNFKKKKCHIHLSINDRKSKISCSTFLITACGGIEVLFAECDGSKI